MVKVKSHTRPAPEREDGPPILLWLANGAADAAADEGARRAQLPGHVVTEVCRVDDLTSKVQKHLVAVALHIASRAPELYGPSSKAARTAEAKLRGKERAFQVEEAKASSAHRVVSDSKGVRCALCHTRPPAELRMQAWLASPCPKIPPRH